MISHYFIQS